jgi:hypothetical protein
LKAHLSPGPDNLKLLAIELAKLLAAFPAQDQSDAAAKLRMAAYCEALAEVPAWAVAEARVRILRGEVESISNKFAPTPPELASIAKMIMRPHRARLDDLLRIQQALATD